ncbi:MAG: hypothetical protein GY798_18180, partial [Hyphomicrobiales bacterium]|nr:hypothetical protein [Hyphomicrobiales bacterium]
MKTHILSSVIGAGSLALVASFTPANAGSDTKSLDLKFFYHLDADMHEQDVFIMRDEDVYRVTKNDDDMTAPLYRSASYVPHAPLEPEKVGPYAPGEPLGFTLGEWLGATGAGTYTCEDGQGTLDVTFDQLMPEGVYTLWHFFMAMPTTDPFIGTFDLPVGARDGSDSVFQADAKG